MTRALPPVPRLGGTPFADSGRAIRPLPGYSSSPRTNRRRVASWSMPFSGLEL